MNTTPLFATALATAALLSTALPVGAITNGTADTEHHEVGALTGTDPGGTDRLCSGTLIDEGVFLTAGHCMVLSNLRITFGDDLAQPGHMFEATDWQAHPAYTFSFGEQFDVGIVLFEQGDVQLPVGRLAPENYVDGFTRAELKTFEFETYGYGRVRDDVNGNSEPLASDSVRRGATQTYLNQHNQYLGLSIHNNKGNGGGCFGDSGGPHLLHGYVVSLTSNGDANCVATDNTQRVDQPVIRDWILLFVD